MWQQQLEGRQGGLKEEDVEHWHYKGEGRDNIVLSYQGPIRSLRGHILRLRKYKALASATSETSATNNGSGSFAVWTRMLLELLAKMLNEKGSEKHEGIEQWKGTMKDEDAHQLISSEIQELEFVLAHLGPLLGSHYLHPPTPVRISQELLQKIGVSVEDRRPATRRRGGPEKNGIDVMIPFGFLQRDHSLFTHESHDGHVLCVEIKPKCGFLPSSPLCAEVKRQYCRYCMHQRLKLSHGEIRYASGYCPIDLFSGAAKRVDRALTSLFYEPQNNIKVFCNGRLAFTGSIAPSSIESVATRTGENAPPPLQEEEAMLLRQERLSTLNEDLVAIGFEIDPLTSTPTTTTTTRKPWEAMKDLVLEVLEHNNILSRILEVQKLDELDIETTYKLYERLLAHIAQLQTSNRTPQLDDSFDVFESLEHFSDAEIDWIAKNQIRTITVRKALDYINNYSLAATAKDCSIMITLYPTSDASNDNISADNSSGTIAQGKWRYRVAIIDTDKKQPDHIPHYYRMDQKIVNNFADLLKHESSSVSTRLEGCVIKTHLQK